MWANKNITSKKAIIEAKVPVRGFTAYETRGGRPYVSQSAVENLVQWSNQAVAVGTANPSDELVYQAQLTPTDQFSNMANMGFCYLTVHIGTVVNEDTQIYPAVGTANADDFKIWGGYDYLQVNNPYNCFFTLYIKNVGTSTYTLSYYNAWQYIQNNSGASHE